MKKIMTIIFLCVLVVACKKKATAPATPAPSTTSVAAMTTQEQQLVGYWVMDSMIMWINNHRLPLNAGYSAVYTNSISCKVEFKSTPFNGPSTGYYQVDDGHANCNVVGNSWKAPVSGFFYINGGQYQITLLTTNQLRFTTGDMTSGLSIYYLHK
jgi:hypothetical protein